VGLGVWRASGLSARQRRAQRPAAEAMHRDAPSALHHAANAVARDGTTTARQMWLGHLAGGMRQRRDRFRFTFRGWPIAEVVRLIAIRIGARLPQFARSFEQPQAARDLLRGVARAHDMQPVGLRAGLGRRPHAHDIAVAKDV
jgi:hypothetical protein